MSGRIRTLKPEFLEDERTASLSHEAARLFVALILLADDYGNFRANAKQLDGAVFWARESLASVPALLRELVAGGLLEMYEVRDQRYGHLTGWDKHQKVDRPSKPRCPGPSDPSATAVETDRDEADFAEGSRDSRDTLASDSRLTPDHDHDHDHDHDQYREPSAPVVDPAPVSGQSVLTIVEAGPAKARRRGSDRLADVQAVFAAWANQRRLKHPRGLSPALDGERSKFIRLRLADGFDVETLKLAAEGVWRSSWNLGQNDRNTEYCDIRHALKDAPTVERFAELALSVREMSESRNSDTLVCVPKLPEAG